MTNQYSRAFRQLHVKKHLNGKYDYGSKDGYSLRDIAYDVKVAFSLEKAPSASTIRNDIRIINEDKDRNKFGYSDEANRLLEPENFPEWRRLAFKAPGGKQYETPTHQLAWFYLIVSLALKLPLADWVIEFLGIEDLDVNAWTTDQERLMSMFLLAPPRHGKSDLLMHTMAWLMMRNPDIRIIWCGGKLEISELTTSWIKAELEVNEFLIANYGPFENEGDWSNKQFTLLTRKTRMRMPTMMAVGKNTTILSLDADFIVVDDFVDLRASESPTQVSKDVRWLTSQLYSRREPWTPLFGIGSHQPSPIGDAYSSLDKQDDNEIKFIKMRAHDYKLCHPLEDDMEESDRHGEHCLLWNGVRPWWFLESMRKALGDVAYEVVYNQDEREGRIEYFREKVIRGDWLVPVMDAELNRFADPDLSLGAGILDRGRSFGQVPHCCGSDRTLRAGGFDPAAGQSRHASESALIVLSGCPVCGRRYLIDFWHKRQSPERHPNTILEYIRMYGIKRFRIEINAYQKALARDSALTDAQVKDGFLIDEWMTGSSKHDPTMGIPVLSRVMELGKFSVPFQTPQDKEKAEAFLSQLVNWPSIPNDIVMALWLAELSTQDYITDFSHNVPLFMGDVEDIPPYLLEDIPEIRFGPPRNNEGQNEVESEQQANVRSEPQWSYT